ncbi:hypothetical protein S40285_07173 [Stachybotrys chlorohalonatus IBT 40285]|uniref:NUDE domain-containing protein n=1 Tax=Stachybotrys chlorohalonatus (strain IBT 40285) TaxID=1283841 RepID=A0A084QAW0_STAC4|nr:hypothetical protein S40285_07173 [Stachybotrys chlorohalonata IBT 40285]
MAEPPSSPPGESASVEDLLHWYKSQYEMVEGELIEFRESSRELEQELEKELEGSETRQRNLQEKAETLAFEVDEWKRKYKESKAEASTAQNTLEKEITTLRETNRTLQLRLRDSEVANDDFERQARNTTSSLEDMESKYNQAIERAVMLEEEIKMGEKERETIRIESQRLREELGELKIEVEVLQDKVKKHESRHLSAISTDLSVLGSPTFDKTTDASPDSTASSPLVTTPPEAKSATAGQLHEPPSPPMSDASAHVPRPASSRTPAPKSLVRKPSRLPPVDSATPKPRSKPASATARAPGGRLSAGGGAPLRTPANRPTTNARVPKLPTSTSLSHIRSLTAQMQRLEARVHSARSKLPAPTNTPPRASPRSTAAMPSTVTIRSRKRTVGSTPSSSVAGDDTTPTNNPPSTSTKPSHVPRLSTSGISRLSFGPLPNRGPESDISRPSSRASMSSYARPSSRNDMVPPPRPQSRTSLSGARTPLGRPRSSMGGSLHGHSASISHMDLEEEDEGEFRTPSRRGTYSKLDVEGGASVSAIPAPSSFSSSRRRSEGRRISTGPRPPSVAGGRPLEDLGETY